MKHLLTVVLCLSLAVAPVLVNAQTPPAEAQTANAPAPDTTANLTTSEAAATDTAAVTDTAATDIAAVTDTAATDTSTTELAGAAGTTEGEGEGEAQPAKKSRWARAKEKLRSNAAMSALKGAVIGAAAGAVRAVITGEDMAESIAVGAIAGASIGFFIGRSKDRVVADRDTNIRNQGWTPDQGTVSSLETLTPASETAVLGQDTEFSVQYFVITSDPNDKVALKFEIGAATDDQSLPTRWAVIQPDSRSIPSGPLMESSFPFKPGRWQPGTYYIHLRITNPNNTIAVQKKTKLDVMAAVS